MRAVTREFIYALLAWFVPFATSVCIFPLKRSNPYVFGSLMGFTLTVTTSLLGVLYLSRVPSDVVIRAARIGITWMAANWILDLMMFSWGPMQMSIEQYATSIATAYFVIPVITVGLGAAIRFRPVTTTAASKADRPKLNA